MARPAGGLDGGGPGAYKRRMETDPLARLALLTCLAATLFMTGLIVFVHAVHYPLFDHVGPAAFGRYHAQHTRRTTAVVLAPMVVELATGATLAFRRPAGTGPALAWAGLAAAVITWAVTGLGAVPAHGRLARGFDAEAHRALLAADAIRVVAWTAHAAIVLVMAARTMR